MHNDRSGNYIFSQSPQCLIEFQFSALASHVSVNTLLLAGNEAFNTVRTSHNHFEPMEAHP